MEFSLPVQEIWLCGLALAIICMLTAKFKGKKAYLMPPEPPGAWPLIGHLRLLGQHEPPHRTLSAVADAYGPVFGLRLGFKRALVISSREAAKECFTVNDKVFPSRPKPFLMKIVGYEDMTIGFAPYGPYWRYMRKMAMTQLLSAHRLELCKHIRETETNSFVEDLYRNCIEVGGSALVEMKDRIGHLTINIILRSVAGKRFDKSNAESRRCLEALHEHDRLVMTLFYSDVAPFLGWLDTINGSVGEARRTSQELDYFLASWVKEHRRKVLRGEIGEREQDFIDVMLSTIDDGRPPQEVDTIIKATCLSLIVGGSATTMVTLIWALSLLLNNKHALKKAQDELDICIGKLRQVNESDINNLSYVKAILKETLRLYPAAPLAAPRIAIEDCTVAGFHIPKGTHLMVNIWKLHRDPTLWKNPSEFVPERFLEEHAHLDIKGQDFEYIPFGSGRRMCPGLTFASQVLHLALARLLHAFEFRTVSEKPIDMTEGPGLILPKETPLEVIVTPRLPAELYVR